MDEIRSEYTLLFNGITETIKSLEITTKRLKLLQMAAENTYVAEISDRQEKNAATLTSTDSTAPKLHCE